MKTVAFLPRFHPLIRAKKKTATTRRHSLGSVGDVLLVGESNPEIKIRLTSVERMRIGMIAINYHEMEGFKTPGGFIETWNEIHPRSGFEPNRFAVLHVFQVVP